MHIDDIRVAELARLPDLLAQWAAYHSGAALACFENIITSSGLPKDVPRVDD